MPLPYNDWDPDHHGQHRHHNHSHHHHLPQHHGAQHSRVANPSQRGFRLPPPGSLVPGGLAASHPHQSSSPPMSTSLFQDRLSADTSPPSYRSPFPPLPSSARAVGRFGPSQQRRFPLPNGSGPRASSPTSVSEFDGSHDASFLRRTQHPPLSQTPPRPQDISSYGHQGFQGPEPPRSSLQQPRQIPPSSLQPSQVRQLQPAPPHRARQLADDSPIPGMPNLLGPGRAEALGSIRFRLTLRQQPKAARACGFGDRDRRVIDPPPIVQLIIEGSTMTDDEVRSYLRYESYVMNCSICDESGSRDASFMPEEYQHQRRLMGSLVGTPFVGQDERGEEGCFFCFSDLSCRTPGAFRLKFTLIMIDPTRAGMVRHFPILTETMSDVFHVYSAKEFPGMLPSSTLAKKLKEQGCIISIKKGNERSKNARGQDELSDLDEEDGESSQGHRKRRTVRE